MYCNVLEPKTNENREATWYTPTIYWYLYYARVYTYDLPSTYLLLTYYLPITYLSLTYHLPITYLLPTYYLAMVTTVAATHWRFYQHNHTVYLICSFVLN